MTHRESEPIPIREDIRAALVGGQRERVLEALMDHYELTSRLIDRVLTDELREAEADLLVPIAYAADRLARACGVGDG